MSAPVGNTYNNKYQPENTKQCHKLCLLGATDSDLADFFEVSRDTIHNWTKKHPEFAEAKRSGKMQADAEVASKLFERAMGCTINKKKVLSNGDIIEYAEELPPETRAMEFWLQCRQRDNWSKNQKVELSGNTENPLAFIMAEMAEESTTTSPLPSGE
ncbi:hypothetical protein [Vibrio breoganii]|uniref:hypothetical protein n=1 Tax=Vibrio breoganii TaxID=553239 RepID=UPI000C817012|nr:hypothetical protein [Vibrio breoganii]PMO36375.1 hypothetical protein BCT12_08290 [Vibrio breoganii]